jgi:radical SAM family uncharacterized protein
VLNILDLGAIPLEARLRDSSFPLVIAGGPCVVNPEPMADFFDLFIIGEAEELIFELIDLYRKYKDDFKSGKLSKEGLLYLFSKIEGVYVPSLYQASYDSCGALNEFKPLMQGVPAQVKKRFIRDLNSAPFPVKWIVPYIQIIHDRVTLEIMRGCPNRCRFCQARSVYWPFRQREIKNALDLAAQLYNCTGYEEFSLAGLSVGEYAGIEELLRGVFDLFRTKAVNVSLPSLKAKAKIGSLSSLISGVKKTGLTFAPEAGTHRLREILAKDFKEEELFAALKEAYASGYQHVKLYFMIGLPFEKNEDLDGIIDLAGQVSQLRKEISGYPAQVNISINTLIPKPHTPLQWQPMQDMQSIKDKQDYLRSKAKNKRLKLDFHDRGMGFVEGLLCRGDRRLSRVILSAFKKGARFDAWGNHFDLNVWQEAFQEGNLDPQSYLRQRRPDELMPWDFLDIGIKKEILLAEYNKLIAME